MGGAKFIKFYLNSKDWKSMNQYRKKFFFFKKLQSIFRLLRNKLKIILEIK